MRLLSLLRIGLSILLPPALVLTTWLYLYPGFHGCAFPIPDSGVSGGDGGDSAFLTTLWSHIPYFGRAYNRSERDGDGSVRIAPFRLLALGDPQLEGDTSVNTRAFKFPHLTKAFTELTNSKLSLLQRIRFSLHALLDFYFDDIPNCFDACRKVVDLLGNDFYLAHIYRTLHWWTKPTHVSVLGDLVGSQWISNDEFAIRGRRYWNRVFRGGLRLGDEITDSFPEGVGSEGDISTFTLGDDAEEWKRRVINIAGNHDIGYAGDLTLERFERFERTYGRANYEIRFRLPNSMVPGYNTTMEGKDIPELRIVVLNSMNLDTPAVSKDLQGATYKFINDVINASPPVEQKGLFTLLLTHIPLYKFEGICVDAPYFDFHNTEEFAYGVKEQNHISDTASRGLLEGIFGLSGDKSGAGQGKGRRGMIVTGHDHEGCDVWHYINQTDPNPAVGSEVLEEKSEDVVSTSIPEANAESLAKIDRQPALSDSEVSQVDFDAETSTAEDAPQSSHDSGDSSVTVEIISETFETAPIISATTDSVDTLVLSHHGPTPQASLSTFSEHNDYSVSAGQVSSGVASFDDENEKRHAAEDLLAFASRAAAEASSVVESASIGAETPLGTENAVVSDMEPLSTEDLAPSDTEPSSPAESDILELETESEKDTVPSWIFLTPETSSSDAETSSARDPQPPSPPAFTPSWAATRYHFAVRPRYYTSFPNDTTKLITNENTTNSTLSSNLTSTTLPIPQPAPLPSLTTTGIPGIREVTLRSMMGEFSGHAGLLSLYFDTEEWEWKAEINDCALGRQHWWWVVHVLDVVVLGVVVVMAWVGGWEAWSGREVVVGVDFGGVRRWVLRRVKRGKEEGSGRVGRGGGSGNGNGNGSVKGGGGGKIGGGQGLGGVDESSLVKELERRGWVVRKTMSPP